MKGLVRALSGKNAPFFPSGPPGQNAGWSSSGIWARGVGGQRLMKLADAYGGGDNGVAWVFACTSLIASTGAGYDRYFSQPAAARNLEKRVEKPPPELVALIDRPNQRQTYFDWVEMVFIDLELVGNSYWLKNRLNPLGQPLELRRMKPEAVKIAKNKIGDVTGYVYTVNGIPIPYTADEVIHWKYPNPKDDDYGMGTVEALLRSVNEDIAEHLHVTGFFQNGARISGVLTIPETITDGQFERLREQFETQYAGAANAFKILLAEGTTDFKPMVTPPAGAGVVDLMKISKDEVLSGFGVPAPLLGGLLEFANYKMEDSQHIFLRTMTPKARRFDERTTLDLVERWDGLQFRLDPQASEPQSVRIENAKGMVAAGATINEGRTRMGLQPSDNPLANEILVNAQMVPLRLVATTLPPAGRAAGGDQGGMSLLPSGRIPIAAIEAYKSTNGTAFEMPELPEGFETYGRIPEGKADASVLQEVIRDHALVLRQQMPAVRGAMAAFFSDQRQAVISKLNRYGSRSAEIRRGKLPKKDLTADSLFDDAAENDRLRAVYMPLVDAIGARAVQLPARLMKTGLSWDVSHPEIAAARDRLGEKITRINDTTREAIGKEVETGQARGYSIGQIANGFAPDDYRGIAGVFDDAVGYRAEMIARSETAMIYNAAATASYRDAGLGEVLVLDGEGDEECAAANGGTWTLDEAEADPIAHPNCVRSFAPLTGGEEISLGDE